MLTRSSRPTFQFHHLVILGFWVVLFFVFLTTAQEPPATEVKPEADAEVKEEKIQIPQSVFINEVGFGLDPFFPNSDRRKAAPEESTTSIPEKPSIASQLQLKGLSANGRRPFAMINNVPFSLGDERRVKLDDDTYLRVRLLEIRQRSVLVSVESQRTPIELKIIVQGKGNP